MHRAPLGPGGRVRRRGRSNPPIESFEKGAAEDAEGLESLPFTCLRCDDAGEVAAGIWEKILPQPFYELTWRTGESEGG